MRVVFYLDDGLLCGGAERVALQLVGYWASLGWTVALITRGDTTSDFYAMPADVERICLNKRRAVGSGHLRNSTAQRPGWTHAQQRFSVRSFARFLVETYRLRKALRALDPDVSIAFLTPANTKLIIASIGLRCCTVVSERNDTRFKQYPRFWTSLRALTYRHADLVTANNRGALEDMARYVTSDRLRELPNPVGLPPIDQLADPLHAKRVIAVGRFVPEKRHELLIEAFSRLDGEFGDWELVLVGDGPLRGSIEQLIAQRGLSGRVCLTGFCGDVAQCYRQAAIFVLSSRFEGMPNALLEAMAHGLPCIVPKDLPGAVGHLDEGRSGLLFASEDAADLTRCMEQLARSPSLRKEMGDAARRKLIDSDTTHALAIWSRTIVSTLQQGVSSR